MPLRCVLCYTLLHRCSRFAASALKGRSIDAEGLKARQGPLCGLARRQSGEMAIYGPFLTTPAIYGREPAYNLHFEKLFCARKIRGCLLLILFGDTQKDAARVGQDHAGVVGQPHLALGLYHART